MSRVKWVRMFVLSRDEPYARGRSTSVPRVSGNSRGETYWSPALTRAKKHHEKWQTGPALDRKANLRALCPAEGREPGLRDEAPDAAASEGRALRRGERARGGFRYRAQSSFYDKSKVRRVWALDPSEEMWAIAEGRIRAAAFPVELLRASAEQIPLASGSADTVLVTYTLCSLPDVHRALGEMARVLKPGGELVFCEHGAAPDESVRRWQDRINPAWKAMGGGCNLNRPIPSLIEEGGFRMREMSSMYIPGWKPASFNYWGRALGAVDKILPLHGRVVPTSELCKTAGAIPK